MVKRCVRLYIEGGAEGRVSNGDFRRCWKIFLNEIHLLARQHGFHSLEVVRGKGRSNTYHKFTKHHSVYPDDLCAILVDAETAVPDGSCLWDIVKNRQGDKWERPTWATESHLYFMVHYLET